MNSKKFTTEFSGKELTVEFTDLAEQAHGSAMVRFGDTVVFATAVMSQEKREWIDYFPLSVDFENEPDIPAILAASLALGTSSIPWDGPIGVTRVGKIDGKLVLNPIRPELEKSDLDMVVCGKDGKINMVEAGAREVPEEEMLEALAFAQKEINKIEEFQKKIIKEVGKEKIMPELKDEPKKISEIFEKDFREKLEKAIYVKDKKERNSNLFKLKGGWDKAIEESVGADYSSVSDGFYEEKIDEIVHKNILEKNLRPDGRGLKELRKLWAGIGIVPRTHGSGLFYRGETHVLSLVTLGGPGDTLLIEGMSISTKKRFIHHYNFPPFAPGETGRMGGPGRREIGHGALAERALLPVIPEVSEFPYVIRLVSEVMSSNGSTSMASTCASVLAMMDAGVPIKRPVAGIAMGLILSADGKKFKVLTDIQGPEDHYGDMDFKSAGTQKGVTAVQMDVKISGVTAEMLKETLFDARDARMKIMAVMAGAIEKPRTELSKFAPRILTVKINPDRIRDLIGPGGKMINSIIDETGATVDVEQDGTVFITGSAEGSEKALAKVKEVTHEFEVGETLEGTVSRIFDFGAMVEIAPKQEGLVHISELATFRVERVTDVVDVGDKVPVKIKSIDELGRINLSIKDVGELNPKVREAGWSPKEDHSHNQRGERGSRFRR